MISRLLLIALLLFFALASPALTAPDEEAAKLAEEAKKLAADGKFAEAVAQMKKAVELAPKNDLYLAVTADFAGHAGKYDEAVSYARKAIELNGKVGA